MSRIWLTFVAGGNGDIQVKIIWAGVQSHQLKHWLPLHWRHNGRTKGQWPGKSFHLMTSSWQFSDAKMLHQASMNSLLLHLNLSRVPKPPLKFSSSNFAFSSETFKCKISFSIQNSPDYITSYEIWLQKILDIQKKKNKWKWKRNKRKNKL